MALSYGQLSAITTSDYIPKLINNIYNTNGFFKRLNRPGFLQLKSGGSDIVAPIVSSKPTSGKWFSDYEELDTTQTDNITAAKYDWKQLHEPIKISKGELAKNSDDAQKLSLVESKMKIAEMNIRDTIGTGLFANGTTNAKSLSGLDNVMSASSALGGIAVADLATWIAGIDGGQTIAANRDLTLPLMQNAVGYATFSETEKPTVGLCRQNVMDQVWALFQPFQRLYSDEMAKLGFENVLMFNGIPMIVDSHAGAGKIYFVDEKNVQLAVMKDVNFAVEKLKDLEAQWALLTNIFWMGNLVTSSRRSNALLDYITVAA